MADAQVSIGADLSGLRRELAKLPNMADGNAQKMLIAVEKVVLRAEKSAKAAAKSIGAANAKAAKQSEKAWEETKKGLLDMGELVGIPGEKVQKLGGAFAALASPAGLATAAVLGIGVAVAGVVVATAAVATGMVSVVRNAKEWDKALKPLRDLQGFEGLPPAAMRSIEQANGAMNSLGMVAKQVGLQLAGDLAPAIQDVALVALKLGLAGLDIATAWLGTHDVLRSFARFVGGTLVATLTSPLDPLARMVEGLAFAARSLGIEVPAGAERASTALRELSTKAGEELADKALDALGGALDGVSVSLGAYDERARALIGTVSKLTAAEKPHAEATKKVADAAAAAAKELAALFEDAQRTLVPQDEVDRIIEMRDNILAASTAVGITDAAFMQAMHTVDQLDARIQGMAEDAARALAQPGEEMKRITDEAVAEAQRGAEEVQRAFNHFTLKVLFEKVKEGLKSIAKMVPGMLDSLTGGLVSTFSPTALIASAAKGGAGEADKMADAAIQFITAIADNLGPLLARLAERMPDIMSALADAIPIIVVAIVKNVPKIAIALVRGIVVELIPALGIAFAQVAELIAAAGFEAGKQMIGAIADWFKRMFEKLKKLLDKVGGGARKVGDAALEGLTLGMADTKTFGDTPGPIEAPLRGLRARFAPGDVVVAAKSMDGVRRQVGAQAPASPAPTRVTLDLTDGHIAFDRLFKRNARAGGFLAELGAGGITGQRKVYA